MKTIKHLLSLALLVPALALAAAGDMVDHSGTITSGGTSQTLAAADPTRGAITITNPSTESEVLCVNVTSAASCSTPGSWLLSPGGSLTLKTGELVTVVAATTGHKFTAKSKAIDALLINPGGSAGGSVTATPNTAATATLSNVAASASNVTCLASNASRKRAVIFNDSVSATLYVKPGATASATSFTWQVPPGGTLTLDTFPIYTGILDCIWSAASGNARVTEF